MELYSYFDEAFEELLLLEGGYVNHPSDPGGETNFGICKRSYPDEDIRNLTKERAKEIYFKDFWAPYHYDQIHDPLLAKNIFHNSVNCGPDRSHLLVQRALVSCHTLAFSDPLSLDKNINFIDKINEIIEANHKEAFYLALKSESAVFRRAIVVNNPTSEVFLKGWLKRAYDEIFSREIKYPTEKEEEEKLLPTLWKNSLIEQLVEDLLKEGSYHLIKSNDLANKLLKTSLDFILEEEGAKNLATKATEALNKTGLLLQRSLRAAGLLPKEIREADNLIVDLDLIDLVNQMKGEILLPAFRAELAGFYRMEFLKAGKLSIKNLLEETMKRSYDID